MRGFVSSVGSDDSSSSSPAYVDVYLVCTCKLVCVFEYLFVPCVCACVRVCVHAHPLNNKHEQCRATAQERQHTNEDNTARRTC